MKKVLVFLLVCLSSTMMFGQAHWSQQIPATWDGTTMTVNAAVYIDGVDQENRQLEIGLFDVATDACRGVKYLPKLTPMGTYYYSINVKGVAGELYTFKLYDHENDREMTELEVVFTEQYPQFGWESNATHGNARNRWIVNFVSPAPTGIEKDIAAYTDVDDHWYLISSPVGEVDPDDVTNMLSDDYDLYYFDQGAGDGLEWINRKIDGTEINDFNLELGKGYLYANNGGGENETVTITFPGEAHTQEVTVNLVKVEGVDWSGWNLIGNPFNDQVSLGTRPFYVMNDENAEVSEVVAAERNYLEPMEGAFVIAEDDGEQLHLSLPGGGGTGGGGGAGGGNDPGFVIRLSHGRGVIDRAIVRFGEGRTLPKFQLNPNHTKVYIPQEGKDYAVVRAGEMGEMPVNFKAEKSGTYSLTFSGENVSFAYLHLIDNLTGADVNLLEVPAYTFDARTTDYASRFKLVFATSDSDDENFAFFNNGNLIISNEGEATLQVVDVMGRILSSETVSGNCSKHIDAAKGVYMIRLINGSDVKVQKIVVE